VRESEREGDFWKKKKKGEKEGESEGEEDF
jgi:hypothetical protein